MEAKKKTIITALKNSFGNISKACESAGISRRTFYNWKDEDPDFRDELDGINEYILDRVENSLLDLIEGGNVTATIFYLKTKGKHRGYIEKQELDHHGLSTTIINLGSGIKPDDD